MRQSAGTLLYRGDLEHLEVLLVHPSGAYNRRAPWSIPKGEPGMKQTSKKRAAGTLEETGVAPAPVRNRSAIWSSFIPGLPLRKCSRSTAIVSAPMDEPVGLRGVRGLRGRGVFRRIVSCKKHDFAKGLQVPACNQSLARLDRWGETDGQEIRATWPPLGYSGQVSTLANVGASQDPTSRLRIGKNTARQGPLHISPLASQTRPLLARFEPMLHEDLLESEVLARYEF